MCFRNHAVWHLTQADQRKKCWRHTGLHLTANNWSQFGSLFQLMRANISYILLYDLLVFRRCLSCATHGENQNTQIHTQVSFLQCLLAERKLGLRAATSKQHKWRQFTRSDPTSQDGVEAAPTVYHPAECVLSTVLITGYWDTWWKAWWYAWTYTTLI